MDTRRVALRQQIATRLRRAAIGEAELGRLAPLSLVALHRRINERAFALSKRHGLLGADAGASRSACSLWKEHKGCSRLLRVVCGKSSAVSGSGAEASTAQRHRGGRGTLGGRWRRHGWARHSNGVRVHGESDSHAKAGPEPIALMSGSTAPAAEKLKCGPCIGRVSTTVRLPDWTVLERTVMEGGSCSPTT